MSGVVLSGLLGAVLGVLAGGGIVAGVMRRGQEPRTSVIDLEMAEETLQEIDREAVATNMVYIDVAGTGRSAADLVAALKERDVVMGALGPASIRAVTHLDVDRAGIERAVAAFAGLLGH